VVNKFLPFWFLLGSLISSLDPQALIIGYLLEKETATHEKDNL
jgi:hypothetical protein